MAKVKFSKVKMCGISTVVPEKVIHIDDELKFYNNDAKKLARHKKILGLGTRHVVEDGITNTDLCQQAAENLFTSLSFDKKDIDAVIVVSTSHDYAYPASACILQHKLNLSEDCACFDVGGLSCSGYVYGVWLAHSLIASGASKKCLLLVGDTASLHSDKRNRNSNMLFGDAGTATIFSYDESAKDTYFLMGTRGSGWNKIIAPASGSKLPIRDDIVNLETIDAVGNVWHLWDEIMRGMDVFRFTTEVVPKSVKELLEFANFDHDDIDFFAFHQANKQIVNTIANHSGIPCEKTSAETFTKYGNCASASIVTVICDQLKDKNYEKVMLGTFGVGLSWGFCLIDMDNVYNDGIKIFNKTNDTITREQLVNTWISYFKGEIDEPLE